MKKTQLSYRHKLILSVITLALIGLIIVYIVVSITYMAAEPVSGYMYIVMLVSSGLIVILLLAVFILMLFVVRSMSRFYLNRFKDVLRREHEMRNELLRKDAEHRKVLSYTQEIEQQYNYARKIQHDYQNILTSLYSYIEDGNVDSLKQYYVEKIESAFSDTAKNLFTLEGLSKIKISGIKGILAQKLMKAQRIGICTEFEAKDEISSVSVDTVSLVRMLGIILDNAIEELLELGAGKLSVACYKTCGGVTFVVQNSCRKDIPELSALKKSGFSTKGSDRGLGLTILSELSSEYDNVTLQTIISNEKFTQKLGIGQGDDL